MPTVVTIDTQRSPTLSSSRSASRSNSYTDEEGSSGTESWEGVSSSELDPSDSASRPPTTTPRYRERATSSRAPPASRAPTRRHITTERSTRRPPASRVHRHPVPAPPSSVDPFDEFPGYGRGIPNPGPYGSRPPQGYAQSSYSGGPGGYAPPFAAPGALTHYGASGGYQYPPANPFSPQPTPAPGGGAGYFNGHHHPMSGHSTPGGYPGHDMMQYPAHANYAGYSGYPAHGMPPQHMQFYPPWPPSEGSQVGPDPETEKKLLAMEEAMKNQKLEYDRVQKELADIAEKERKEAAEKAEQAQKAIDERNAKFAAERAAVEAAKKAAEEKAAWERKMEDEKKQALALFEAAQKKAAVDAAEAAKKAAEEKAAWERKVEDEKKQALANFEAAQKKAAAEAAEAAKKAAEETAAWEKKLELEKQAAMEKGLESARKAQEEAKKKEQEKAAEEAAKAAVAAELAAVKKEAAEEAKKLKEEHEKLKKEAEEKLAKALSPPSSDKKKPIKFKDAVGRKFSFPFELCTTWAGMDELIKQAFLHVDVIGPHVQEGHYDLIGPNGEIILPRVWDTTIEPDWSITMHMWPMPEPPKGGPMPPGPPPGHHFQDRPRSRHGHSHHRGGMPPPPPSTHRGGVPPPPPANWPGGPMPPRPPPAGGPGPGGIPVIVNLGAHGPSRPSRRKPEPAKGVLSWMAGSNTKSKSSGKGPKKAEQHDPCCVM